MAARPSRNSPLVGPGDLAQDGERVEELGGPERDPLGAERLGELEQARGDPGGADGRPGAVRQRPTPASAAGQLQADPLGDDVEIGAVLDDHRHRLAELVVVDVLGAEQQQGAGPVDRLGDRRRLLEVERADGADHLDKLAGDRQRQSGACIRTIASSCSSAG